MKKNISYQLKIMKISGEKKENVLTGLNLIQKLKMLNTVNLMLK